MNPTETPSTGVIREGAHWLAVRVYYEDTDFSGVVYHASYLRFMERGRSELLRSIGPPPGAASTDPGVFAVVRMEIDFRAPARIHDALAVRTALAGMKGPRLIFRQAVQRGELTLVEAIVTAVPLHPDGRLRRPDAAELAHWTGLGTS